METDLEHTLSQRNKAGMLSYMESNPKELKELICLALSNKQPYAWRAAWVMRSYLEKNDKRIRKHVSKIIHALPALNDSQQRDLMFVLQKMEIAEKEEGLLLDICIDTWCKIDKKPSVRHNAFRLIGKLMDKHPAIYHEIILLTTNQYTESLSPGIKHSIHRMINEIKHKLNRTE